MGAHTQLWPTLLLSVAYLVALSEAHRYQPAPWHQLLSVMKVALPFPSAFVLVCFLSLNRCYLLGPLAPRRPPESSME